VTVATPVPAPENDRSRTVRRDRTDRGAWRRAYWTIARGIEPWEVLRNPLAYVRLRRFRSPATIRFRDGFSIAARSEDAPVVESLVALARQGVRFAERREPAHRIWGVSVADRTVETPTGIRFALDTLDAGIFAETFVYDVHFAGFDLGGRTVVDAGANVGDTALYYAERGAEVHAYEPDPENYRRLLGNLELNPGLRARVHPHPEAVGRDGTVEFTVGLRGSSGRYATGGRRVSVPSKSLASVLGDTGQDLAYLLKADCKGAEYELVRQPELARFDRVAIEYVTAFGDLSVADLEHRLRTLGFSRVRVVKHNGANFPLDAEGLMLAER
jgi:FkbM family methyltransferase